VSVCVCVCVCVYFRQNKLLFSKSLTFWVLFIVVVVVVVVVCVCVFTLICVNSIILITIQDLVFNEKFEFDIEESHNYLNICVWCEIPEKLDKQSRVIKPEKDILLGHVSVI